MLQLESEVSELELHVGQLKSELNDVCEQLAKEKCEHQRTREDHARDVARLTSAIKELERINAELNEKIRQMEIQHR